MALPDTTVKFFHSEMIGAPVLNGVVGSSVNLFDILLLDTGFGQVAVSSIVITDNVATVTTIGVHNFEMVGTYGGPVVVFSGSVVTGDVPGYLNQEFRIATIPSTTTFTFAVEGLGNQTATGSVTVKRAGLGWSKPFSGTNKAVYMPAFPHNKQYLRVLDDATVPTSAAGRWSKWRGYETMTDVDNGSGLFPTVVQSTNGLSLNKSSTSNATARKWILIGDRGIFYIFTLWNEATSTEGTHVWDGYYFGTVESIRAGDMYNTIISAGWLDTLPANPSSHANCCFGLSGSIAQPRYIARSYTQLGGSKQCTYGGSLYSVGFGHGNVTYPAPQNGGLIIIRPTLLEGTNDSVAEQIANIRSTTIPGIYVPAHNRPLRNRDIIENVIPDRTLYCVDCASQNGAITSPGNIFFDLTGPWR